MSTPVISKGSSILLEYGSDSQEMKSIVIEDPTPTVGEAEAVSITAHDGTKYTTAGSTGDSGVSLVLLQTYEDFKKCMTYAYGSPTVTGSVSTWDLSSPSNTSGTLTVETPVSGDNQISWRLKSAKALSVTPGFAIGQFATMTMNITGANWEALLDENATP